MAREKKCTNCEEVFICGDTLASNCWCNEYPAIFELASNDDCVCKSCLHKASKVKIENYVSQLKQKGLKYNIAPKLSNNASLLEELDYYTENGYWVFTEWYHLKRGNCCRNGCRHCPY